MPVMSVKPEVSSQLMNVRRVIIALKVLVSRYHAHQDFIKAP
jgi:hypothetical protein